MIRDDISDIVKQDSAILNYGSLLFTSGGTEKSLHFTKNENFSITSTALSQENNLPKLLFK